MRHWDVDPEAIVLDVEAPPPSKRQAAFYGSSFVLHALVVVVLVALQIRHAEKAPKDVPVFPLTFEEPVQPRPRAPSPAIRMPQLAPAPVPPAAPAPATPQAPDDRPLIGFSGHGQKKGQNERPPGPEAKKHGPGEPGEGKGMKDPGTLARPDEPPRPEPAPGANVPEDTHRPETPPRADRADESPGGIPRPEAFPRPGEEPPLPSGRPGAPSSSRTEGPRGARPGNPGQRGSGSDFKVGMGGMFGDLEFDSGDYPWDEYSRKVYWAIYRAWLRELYNRVPRFERDQAMNHLDMLEGECTIHFVIHRDGSVDTIDVRVPSPMRALDEASSAALARAVLPPIPRDFPRNQEGVAFRLRVSGFQSSRQLQLQLEYARSNGDF